MRRALALLLCAAALAWACRRAPGAAVRFGAPDGSFSASVPGDWKVDEAPGETRKAAFYGPPTGPGAFSQLMGVYFHAGDPQAARASLPDAAGSREVKAGDAAAYESVSEQTLPDPHLGSQRIVKRVVVVPAAGGYYSLEHTWPAGAEPAPAFDELLRTFKPAAK